MNIHMETLNRFNRPNNVLDTHINKLRNKKWDCMEQSIRLEILKLNQKDILKLSHEILREMILFIKASTDGSNIDADSIWYGSFLIEKQSIPTKELHRAILWQIGDSIDNIPQYINSNDYSSLISSIVNHITLSSAILETTDELLENNLHLFYKRFLKISNYEPLKKLVYNPLLTDLYNFR